MSRVNYLEKLFRALAVGDREAALATGRIIADEEAKLGHSSASRSLRSALAQSSVTSGNRDESDQLAVPFGQLIREPEGPQLNDVMLDVEHEARAEWHSA